MASVSPGRERAHTKTGMSDYYYHRKQERGEMMDTATNKSPRETAPTSTKINRGQVAAAKLIMKRDREGKGNVKITQRIRDLAAIEL